MDFGEHRAALRALAGSPDREEADGVRAILLSWPAGPAFHIMKRWLRSADKDTET
ncbi:MAG: hypothetical protein ACREE4_01145 [Stellaceae bacterium]